MLDTDLLVLEDEVRGSLGETLVLRGTVRGHDVVVLFAAQVLDHWPKAIQAERLNEMRSFIETATRRALDRRQFSVVDDMPPGGEPAYVVVLTWADIAT